MRPSEQVGAGSSPAGCSVDVRVGKGGRLKSRGDLLAFAVVGSSPTPHIGLLLLIRAG